MNGLFRKLADIDFIEFLTSYDIIFLSETWLNKKHLTDLSIQGFESYHVYGQKSTGVKKGRLSGGLSIYFRKELKNEISVIETNNFGIIWIKINHNLLSFNEDLYCCHTYIPPPSSKVLIDKDFDFFEEIEKGIEKFSKLGKTFITGDFNSRTAQLSDILHFDKYLDDDDDDDDDHNDDDGNSVDFNNLSERRNKDLLIDNNGRKLISLCKSTDHIIANGRLHDDTDGNYTFISARGSSVTDYLIFNKHDINVIKDFKVLDFSNCSDHAPLYFTILICNDKNEPIQNDSTNKTEQKIVFNEEKITEYEDILKQNLNELDACINSESSLNTQAETLTEFFYENAIGKPIPVNRTNNKFSPKTSPKWYNADCHRAKQEFKTARNTFNRNRTDQNRVSFVRTRTKYNRVRKQAKRCFKLNEGERLEKIAKSQPRKFWKSIKKCYSKPKNTGNDIKIDDLYNHFNTLLDQEPESINQMNNIDENNIEDFELDLEITEQEIRKALFKQKNGKASGPDEISAEILKASYNVISPYLVKLFNMLFNDADYPESWSLGYIVPIFKGGESSNAKNYRGITLNNIIAKVYSQVLLNRLTEWTEKYEKISNCQFGYQKGKSTVDCIFILHAIISKVLNSGQKLYSVFIDYEKCFDRINRTFLWQKLLTENVSSRMINALKAMYSTVRSIIKHNRQTSSAITSNLGVKQGDPSSSLLFMMFVNDIITCVNTDLDGIFSTDDMKLFLILFADDQVLFSTSPASLQSMLNDIETYCTAWGLKINLVKTKVLIFEKKTK